MRDLTHTDVTELPRLTLTRAEERWREASSLLEGLHRDAADPDPRPPYVKLPGMTTTANARMRRRTQKSYPEVAPDNDGTERRSYRSIGNDRHLCPQVHGRLWIKVQRCALYIFQGDDVNMENVWPMSFLSVATRGECARVYAYVPAWAWETYKAKRA